MTTSEPSIAELNNLNPMLNAGVPKEPIALIDTSGSMSYPAAEGSTVSRWDIVCEAMGMLVLHLEDEDSQAATEQADGSDDKGGLLTYGFASGVTEFEDLNSSNWRERFGRAKIGGGTYIMPAWDKAQAEYLEEFEDCAVIDRPALMALVISDGEAADAAEFTHVLENAGPGRYFCVGIVGFGEEHDRTLAAYKKAEKSNPKHVRVVTFGGETDPTVIADGLKSLVG